MAVRYGIGEIFGRDVSRLTAGELRSLARTNNKKTTCPFLPDKKCRKKGGVCSLRQYEVDATGMVRMAPVSSVTATCPVRFREGKIAFEWIGEVLLGTNEPIVLN